MLLGGVLAFQGRVTLGWMIFAGCVGAVVGDSLGYEIGRHFGQRMMRSKIGRRIGQDRWDRASAYLRRRGGRAIFFGRFVGFLRALVPALAGSAGIEYPTFLAFNVAGGVIWATSFILLGYAAGGSWRVVEHYAGRASLLLAGFVAVAAGFYFAGRYILDHRRQLRTWFDDLLERPLLAGARRRFRRQIDFFERRLQPGQRFGLVLTVGLTLVIVGAWVFGSILQDVLVRDELALFDRPIVRYLATHRTPALTNVMRVVTNFGAPAVVILVLTVVSGWAYARSREWRWFLFSFVTLGGAIASYTVLKVLVHRPRPNIMPLLHVGGYAFPSGHATAAAATYLAASYIVAHFVSWKVSVWIWTAAVFLTCLVAFSRVYLGVHWPTDVMGGIVLGMLWAAITATAIRMISTARPAR
jgi:undecaprenyl-diphosphatase